MPQEITEQGTTQSLEDILKEGQPSTEKEEVSEKEEIKEPEKEKTEEEKAAEAAETLETRIQAEVDKRANTYREKREADTALIRSLSSQLKDLKSERVTREGNKRLEAILAGDEEAGVSPDESKSREQALKEFNQLYKDYKEKSAEVEDTAQFIGNMTEKLPANIIKEFGLDDANPNIRAVNGVKFLEETVAVYKHNLDFLMVVEDFLPKGDELRKQIEEIVDGLGEFTDEKSKKLYLKDKLQGVKVTPRKKPQTPSETLGGVGLPTLGAKTDTRELLERGFRRK